MSAFNDYCLVCDKQCSSHSAYCCDECKNKDSGSHFEFNNVPQLISPVLQPRSDSIASTLSTSHNSDEETEEEKNKQQEYLIKSPLLLSSTVKDQSIAGLNLNDFIPRDDERLDDRHAQLLAASSNNYKKWLNVVL